MFFDSIKKKVRNKNILWAVISIVVSGVSIYLAISNGFSSETNWKLGLRFSDLGIPVPDWMITCLFILMGLIFAGLFISSVKDIFTNNTYNKLIATAQSLGDVSYIDQMLASIPKSNLTKGGDLRYNNILFFYMKGTDIFLFHAQQITSIQPVKKTGKNTEFYVEIQAQDKNIKIDTKEDNLIPLANDIYSCLNSAQYT